MKTEIKVFLIAFFISGGIFAAGMTVVDFSENGIFPIKKFLYYFLGYGTVMGVIFVFMLRKKAKISASKKAIRKNDPDRDDRSH